MLVDEPVQPWDVRYSLLGIGSQERVFSEGVTEWQGHIGICDNRVEHWLEEGQAGARTPGWSTKGCWTWVLAGGMERRKLSENKNAWVVKGVCNSQRAELRVDPRLCARGQRMTVPFSETRCIEWTFLGRRVIRTLEISDRRLREFGGGRKSFQLPRNLRRLHGRGCIWMGRSWTYGVGEVGAAAKAKTVWSGLMHLSFHSPVSTGMWGQGQSTMLTCGSESTRAPCCVVCWACGSGSLMSGLGMWTLRTNWSLEESPGKSEQSPLLVEPLSFAHFVMVSFLCAGFSGLHLRNKYLGKDTTLKLPANVGFQTWDHDEISREAF